MNKFHLFIQKIHDLSATRKTLSPEAMEHLKAKIQEHMEATGKEDITDVLPFIVLYVYNEAYLSALNDVLAELHTVR